MTLYDLSICLSHRYTVWKSHCSSCLAEEIMLFEIVHKDKSYINVGSGFFISHVMNFFHFNRTVYCIGISSSCIYHKNPTLRGDRCICKIHDLHNLYSSALFLVQYSNHPPALQDFVAFYLCQYYHPEQKSKWSSHLTQNILQFVHAMKMRGRYFYCITRHSENCKFFLKSITNNLEWCLG